MADVAKLKTADHELEFPILEGSENEKALDISKLRGTTGLITIDEGYVNTGSTRSEITFLDGEKGVLRYRGYPIEDLASKCDFLEVCYLLIYGELPTNTELDDFQSSIRKHTMLHEDMRNFYNGFPRDAHPMATLSSVVSAMSTFYQDALDPSDPEHVEICIQRLIAKLPTIAAYSHKKSIGQPFMYPENDLSYVENFLRMMFSVPCEPYEIDPDFVKAFKHVVDRPCGSRTKLQYFDGSDGWARPTRTCSHLLLLGFVLFGGRFMVVLTKLSLKCLSKFATTVEMWTST